MNECLWGLWSNWFYKLLLTTNEECQLSFLLFLSCTLHDNCVPVKFWLVVKFSGEENLFVTLSMCVYKNTCCEVFFMWRTSRDVKYFYAKCFLWCEVSFRRKLCSLIFMIAPAIVFWQSRALSHEQSSRLVQDLNPWPSARSFWLIQGSDPWPHAWSF